MLHKLITFILCIPLFTSTVFAAEVNSFKVLDDTHIRTLAASCAACHGTNGNSVGVMPVLAGLDANYFSTQMAAFKSGEHKATVMHRHAKGLYTDEIELLAKYFSQQKRTFATPLKSQTLREQLD